MNNLDLRYAPVVRYQVDKFRVRNWESMYLRYSPMVRCQVEMDMLGLRDLHWQKIGYLVHNIELR